MTRAGDTLRHSAGDHPSPLVVHSMSPGIVQIPGDVSVREAARIMRREHAPCLLVKDVHASLGIITHSDIVYKVAAPGLNPSEVDARAIMTRPVETIEYDKPGDDAVTLMASKGIPLLVVTKLKQPIGVLTVRDLAFSPRRPLPRIAVTMSILGGKSRSPKQAATLTQLSQHGGVVETASPAPTGTRLSLSFYLPRSSRPIKARAVVVRSWDDAQAPPAASEPPIHTGMEVQFSRLSASDQSHIVTWVLRTLYKQFGEQ